MDDESLVAQALGGPPPWRLGVARRIGGATMSEVPVEQQPEGTQTCPPDVEAATADEASEATRGQRARAALIEASQHHPFGPAFFMTQLRGFAGEKCPNPAAGLPVVEIHLADGEVLELCHIIGVTPTWVALAVNETDHTTSAPHMRTEFVPFETIARVTLRSSRPESPHLGFEHSKVPQVFGAAKESEMTPEAAIEAAATSREDL